MSKIFKKITTDSSKATEVFAEGFASEVKPGDVIYLFGDLGAGKTTFTKGFAKGFGIMDRIISPTFNIIREHDVQGGVKFYHVDLYRLDSLHQIEEIGLSDIIHHKNSITVIEWAEKLGEKLSLPRWEIHLKHGEDNTRIIEVKKFE